MKIEREKLIIPGIQKKYTFYHISDAHIVCVDENSSDEDRQIAEKHTKKWNKIGIPPIDAFSEMIDFVNESEGDALMIAGDCTDYYRPCIAEFMRQKLSECNKEVLYVYGNHEGADYYKPLDYKTTFPEFAPLMQNNPSHWVKDFGEFLVVGIDNSTKNISPEQMAFLREQISRNVPIVILMHIPIGSEACDAAVASYWGSGEDNKRYFILGYEGSPDSGIEFTNLLKEKDNNIVAIFAGHIHTQSSGEYAPGKMQYTSAPTYEKYVRIIEIAGE